MAMSIFDRIAIWLRRFARAEQGNFALIFALTATMLMTAGGAGVDFTRTMVAKNRIGRALDAAALAVGSTTGSSERQLQVVAQQYFDANYPEDALGIASPVQVRVNGPTISLSVTGRVPTTLLKIAGLSELNLSVTNQVMRATNAKLHVVLVLDNTGSMRSYGKMQALQNATHDLLDTLEGAAQKPRDVLVSIVPFAREVNVGPTNAHINAPWIDWEEWDAENGDEVTTQECSGSSKGRGRRGRGRRGGRNCTTTNTWVPADHNTWNGCVADRDQSYDVLNTTPRPNDTSTLFPAEQSSYCPVPIVALTNDWKALHGRVDDMEPRGDTNQTIGLAWGWQALTQG